ncbi:RHS repeat-associated core domain-containing protein [Rapidithrix thailandica]|uniref:RHS repeat-associated core domain-containing protein n=1 Tax=Rapidithrix thailandica TaxID=413964 RepID=A0AAW9S069_9BACT
MAGRNYSDENYRYGFNGKENDKDFGHQHLIQDYGFRLYNPEIGKFLSVDPLTSSYPWNSTYAFAENRVIDGIDLDGTEWESKHKWTDIVPGTSMTYANGWRVQSQLILQKYLTDGSTIDCADLAARSLIEYAHNNQLPFHLEGSNTSVELRLFDNDLMQYQTWQQLAKAVGDAYAASDFFNNSVFLLEKSFDKLEAGDLVLWNWYQFGFSTDIYHVQTVVEILGEDYKTIQGSTGSNASEKTYSIENVSNGRRDVLNDPFPNSTKAKSWNFTYFDKFVNYNSMEQIDSKFSVIKKRLTMEILNQLSMGGTFEDLSHNDRQLVRFAATYELYTGKKYFGTYIYRKKDFRGHESGGYWEGEN